MADNEIGELVPEPSYEGPIKLRWLAPIRGIFQDLHERWVTPWQEQPMEPLTLMPGVEWRAATDEDRRLMGGWFSFYEQFVARDEAERLTGADSVLSGEDTLSQEEARKRNPFPIVLPFIIGASLHTECFLRTQWLRFDQQSDGTFRPHSGGPAIRLARLESWPLQQRTTAEDRRQIAETFQFVKRAFEVPHEHSFLRAVGAYRVAMTSTFVDATPILLCAALEALAGDFNSAVVIRRLVPRYLTSTEDSVGRERLEALYLLRHWFAHSALIPKMSDMESRKRALSEGVEILKEILRAAVADDSFFEASASGVKKARAYLDS
jgi:hypothetical protein